MQITYSNETITPEDVVRFLSLTGQSHNIYYQIITHKEVLKKSMELGIEVSVEQLQQFANNLRSLKGLHSAQEMLSFLENSGLTVDDFETFCEASLLTGELKDRLADEKKIEEYFINNRPEFDAARISVIVIGEEELANEILMQVSEDGEDFHALARRFSLDKATKYSGGYVGVVTRKMLSIEISAKVFNADADELLGPFHQDKHYQLILVEEVIKPELNDSVKEKIKELIFGQWLSQFLEGGVKVYPS